MLMRLTGTIVSGICALWTPPIHHFINTSFLRIFFPWLLENGPGELFLTSRESNIVVMNWTGESGTTNINGVLNNSYETSLKTTNEIKISPSGAIFVGMYCFLHAVNS